MDSEMEKKEDPGLKDDLEQSPGASRVPEQLRGLPPAPEQGEVEKLREELEEAQRERGQFKSLLQRTQADFVNFRRRVEEEREEFQKATTSQLILRILPVLDDLERAMAQPPPEAQQAEGWAQGIRLVLRKFQQVLEEAEVRRIEARGKSFDPWEHAVVSYEETTEHPEGRVIKVVREGYTLHGKVLRPSLVSVAKAPAEATQPPAEPPQQGQET